MVSILGVNFLLWRRKGDEGLNKKKKGDNLQLKIVIKIIVIARNQIHVI